MREDLDVKRARHEFSEFISDLSGTNARMTTLSVKDSPTPRIVEVSLDVALNSFLREHPEHASMRQQIEDQERDIFSLNKDLWETYRNNP